ncbi:MAG: type II toxin-antitoxin system death-on-curing family toxin [Alphaproteobacteria bacterium]|nr:type II toxin-antitoxin system death-on-curing family toxin [Alphaproteobacteria bacterium]
MSAVKWVCESVTRAIHDEQIAEHGGLSGIRDEALLQSALAAPKNLLLYEHADIAALAACYAVGIAGNHPFNDGNKRTAFVVAELFLALNGYDLMADDASCVMMMLDVAAGHMSVPQLAAWFRPRICASNYESL